MSVEALPSAAAAHEAQVDQATIAEIDAIESAEQPSLSPAGSRLIGAAERVNAFLEKRVVNKAHGEALSEEAKRSVEAQDGVYATYDENLSATADRENAEAAADKAARREARAEKIADAKNTVRSWGAAALKAAKRGFGNAKNNVELAAVYTTVTVEKVRSAAQKAQVRAAERAAYREDKARQIVDQNDAFATYETNVTYTQDREAQDDAFATYEDNVAFSQAHEDALKINEQKKADQATAYDSYADNIDTTALREAWEQAKDERLNEQHAEALGMNADFDAAAAREAIMQRARAARIAKIRRQQARRELMNRGIDVAGSTWQAAKGLTKKFGRSLARFARRGAKVAAGAARGAVQGARSSYQQTSN